MSYSDRYGDRDRDRERDWIRDERLRARGAYEQDEEARRLDRSYNYPSGGRDERDYERDRAERRSERSDRDYGRQGYIPFGATGPTYYGGGYSGEPRRYPGDVGRSYAGEDTLGGYGRQHEIPRGHYFGDTSRERDRADYVPNPREGRGEEGRTWLDKAADEAKAFFGDEDARRRRHWDELRHAAEQGGGYSAGEHRGRGPRGYRRSDERIREDVSDRLTDDPWLDASYIDVEVKDGEVTLSGLVASRHDKRRAEDLADSSSGVSHVQNNLRIQSTDTRTMAGETGTLTGTTGERRDTLETGGTSATQANTRTSGRA